MSSEVYAKLTCLFVSSVYSDAWHTVSTQLELAVVISVIIVPGCLIGVMIQGGMGLEVDTYVYCTLLLVHLNLLGLIGLQNNTDWLPLSCLRFCFRESLDLLFRQR